MKIKIINDSDSELTYDSDSDNSYSDSETGSNDSCSSMICLKFDSSLINDQLKNLIIKFKTYEIYDKDGKTKWNFYGHFEKILEPFLKYLHKKIKCLSTFASVNNKICIDHLQYINNTTVMFQYSFEHVCCAFEHVCCVYNKSDCILKLKDYLPTRKNKNSEDFTRRKIKRVIN